MAPHRDPGRREPRVRPDARPRPAEMPRRPGKGRPQGGQDPGPGEPQLSARPGQGQARGHRGGLPRRGRERKGRPGGGQDPGQRDEALRGPGHLVLARPARSQLVFVQWPATDDPLDLVFVATGILHDGDTLQPEKTWRSLDPAALRRSFDINCIGPTLVAKHLLPLLRRDRKAVFAALSARVGSIADNQLGGWYGYRASKAALNMTIRTLAIELARRNPSAVCVGLHPGTVDSELSRPFQRGVPADRLFSPERAAAQLLAVIDDLTPQSSGRLFAWDGSEIPF